MSLYKIMYTSLFNAVTDALTAIKEQNFGIASELLMQAQIDCENIYIEGEGGAIKLVPFGTAKEETNEN